MALGTEAQERDEVTEGQDGALGEGRGEVYFEAPEGAGPEPREREGFDDEAIAELLRAFDEADLHGVSLPHLRRVVAAFRAAPLDGPHEDRGANSQSAPEEGTRSA